MSEAASETKFRVLTILYLAASKHFLVFNATFDARWTNIIP